MTTSCSRVMGESGAKTPSLRPVTTFFSDAHWTAPAYQAEPVTSLKPPL